MKLKATPTEKQKLAFKEAIKAIKKANKTGLSFYGMQGNLVAYTSDATSYRDSHGIENLLFKGETIPYLSADVLIDSGADDYACCLPEDEIV